MELAHHHLQVLRDEARQVQERLRSAGYNPGAADGVPGPQTVAALRQYQTAQGVPVTGFLDEATRQALGLVPDTAARQSGERPRFVYRPQPTLRRYASRAGKGQSRCIWNCAPMARSVTSRWRTRLVMPSSIL
jgi:hypothetical protein